MQNVVQKVILAVFVNLVQIGIAFSAPKTEGPTNVQPGDLCRIAISDLGDLNDVKIACYPSNGQWESVKRLDGTPVILFFAKDKGQYNFVIAGNKNNLTTLVVHSVTVGDPVPPPAPTPPPAPAGGKYTAKLSPFYMVSPDNESLQKLINIYTTLATQAASVSNYQQMNDALAKAVLSQIGAGKLQPLKDAVADILQADLANHNSTPYNAASTAAIFNELAKSLQPLVTK